MTDSLADHEENGARRPPPPRMPVLPRRVSLRPPRLQMNDWPGSNEQLPIPDEVLREAGF